MRIIAQEVLDALMVRLVRLRRSSVRIARRRCVVVRRIGRVQPVAEVVSAAVAETVRVVRWCAVGDAFGGSGIGVAKGMSLEGKMCQSMFVL